MIPWSFDRKQLEEWLASKGKTYKRPPMTLLQKKPVKLSWRNVKEKEKQEKPEQLCLEKINNILTECLKLVEEVGMGKELLEQVPLLLEVFLISQEMRATSRPPPSSTEGFGASILARLAAVARGVTSCVGKVLVELRIGQRHAARCANRENGAIPGHGACVCRCRCPGTWQGSVQQEFLRQQPRLIEPPLRYVPGGPHSLRYVPGEPHSCCEVSPLGTLTASPAPGFSGSVSAGTEESIP